MPRNNACQWNAAPETAPMTEDRPSRSQKKRDSAALQKLGEELAALPETILAAFPLSAKTREAMREWRRVSSREGKRRQMQYIGRLMREETDIPALRKALAAHAAGGADDARALLQAERLRAALMEADPEETERLLRPFSTAESALDTAAADPARELLDLVRKARNEREHGRPPHAFRALFRRLRDIQPVAPYHQPAHGAGFSCGDAATLWGTRR